MTYIFKIIEKLVCRQLVTYLDQHSLIPSHLSAYGQAHSETAILKVISDALMAADHGEVTLVGLLDLSPAFDTVDHDILLIVSESHLVFRVWHYP